MILSYYYIVNDIIVKCKISAIWLVGTACMFLMFLIVTVQITIMEYEMQES